MYPHLNDEAVYRETEELISEVEGCEVLTVYVEVGVEVFLFFVVFVVDVVWGGVGNCSIVVVVVVRLCLFLDHIGRNAYTRFGGIPKCPVVDII